MSQTARLLNMHRQTNSPLLGTKYSGPFGSGTFPLVNKPPRLGRIEATRPELINVGLPRDGRSGARQPKRRVKGQGLFEWASGRLLKTVVAWDGAAAAGLRRVRVGRPDADNSVVSCRLGRNMSQVRYRLGFYHAIVHSAR